MENCNICFLTGREMIWLECFHSLCNKCLGRLKKKICPFCRWPIASYVMETKKDYQELAILIESEYLDERKKPSDDKRKQLRRSQRANRWNGLCRQLTRGKKRR